MEKRKEFIKSLILFFLIVSSVFLTSNIVGYKPEYDILGIKQEKQKANQNNDKISQNTLNLLSPDIIFRKDKHIYEEKPQKNSIIKTSTVQAIKNRDNIKNLLSKINEHSIEETRLRNRAIEEIITQSDSYFIFKYNNKIDTISSKIIYLGENNSNSSFEFDEVLISNDKPNNLYLYKKGDDSYFQIEYGGDIFSKISEHFENNATSYSVYNIDARKDVYISNNEDFYIDTFNYRLEDISTVSKNIFLGNKNIKISNRDDGIREVTDGYSILRETNHFITYINPSNIVMTTSKILEKDIEEKASSFLVTGYLPDKDYTISKILDNEIIYQEIYKDGLVFTNDDINYLKISVSSDGISSVKYPRLIKTNQISSEKLKLFGIENISELLNYLYQNVKLENVEDVVLGYEKKYGQKQNVIYTPRWYVKYKNEYILYSELREKITKGEL